MDLHAAFDRVEPIEIEAIEELEDPRRAAGPRRPLLEDVHVRYATSDIHLVVRIEEAPDARGLDGRARDLRARTPRGAIPVLAAPYIGPAMRRRLEALGVGWLDSLGNIHAQRDRPALLLHIEARGTRASLAKFRGRLFSPAHSRVARALLERPNDGHRLKDLATLAETDPSSVSRAMRVFVEANLAERFPDGWRVPDPRGLLDAWLDHALARPVSTPERWFADADDPTDLMRRMAAAARAHGFRIAFTSSRTAAIVLAEEPPPRAAVEAYVEPFDRGVRTLGALVEPAETPRDRNVKLIASARGGAFVGADQDAPLPLVGRMQLVTDLFRAGRDTEAVAQRVRERWQV